MTHRSPLVRSLLTFFLVAAASSVAAAPIPADLWQDVDDDTLLRSGDQRDVIPTAHRTVELDLRELLERLAEVPSEPHTDATRRPSGAPVPMALPLPDGSFAEFLVVESPIMAPELAARYPEIRTYRGQGVDDPAATVRFDVTPSGFHAQILSPAGRTFVDPYRRGDTALHVVYRAADLPAGERELRCGVDAPTPRPNEGFSAPRGVSTETLRTYRLAVAATGEYTAFHGGTVEAGLAAIVTAMNRVNQIYEAEVAVRMVLVADNDDIVYTNAATDPYSNFDGLTMLGQNQTNLDSVIGSANYDIGHVFSTGGGGIATLGSPCRAGLKARGVTGLPSPTGDAFWVDFVAHEMGHQWGGNHTFNGNDGNCAGGNRNPTTAYEPGSGSTIQAYAGICGSQNLQSNSDPYFHGISLDEILAYTRTSSGDDCDVPSATGNTAPTVDAGDPWTIPLDTPFELCGSGSDPDVDPLTFAWEQFDLGPAGHPNTPSGNAPIFRSFSPTDSPCRTFPRMTDLVAGTQTLGEILPTYARTMSFRLTARDNRSGGGGTANTSTTVTVTDQSGPFRVTGPAGGSSFPQDSLQTVTWDVAMTDQAPVSCATVDILLSTDGGLTFPSVLESATPNDGTEEVALPDAPSGTARIQVRCASTPFFHISDGDFSIGFPVLSIDTPSDGAQLVEGTPVTFSATATDPEDGVLSTAVEWTDSVLGPIAMGATFDIANLPLGTHVVTAAVADSDTNEASDAITVHVEPACVSLDAEADYEVDAGGWVNGASTCTTGTFVRGTPDEVSDGGVITQPDGAASGTFAWFTRNNAGGVGTDDVDGGTCETLSPAVAVGAGGSVTVLLDYFHGQRDAGGDPADGFSIELIDASTEAVVGTLVEIGDETSQAIWTPVSARFSDAPASVRLRVRATDGTASGDLVEGGIDNVRICTGLPEGIFADGFEIGSTAAWGN